MKYSSGHFLALFLRANMRLGCIWLVFLAMQGCTDGKKKPTNTPTEAKSVFVPMFQADSAYAHIEKQLSFGPRVPNLGSHINCGQWLGDYLEKQGAKLYRQTALLTAFNGDKLSAQNIIAEFNGSAQRRIMLSAHWDTRPFAEADSIRQDEAIPGANDGASGVAVLLEIARNLQEHPLDIGIDIMLWDAEDYGNPQSANSYGLGSQYWAKNPHKPNYSPMFGINLDMVGAQGAQFCKEEISMNYAPHIIEKVWLAAHKGGFASFFSHIRSNPITDDHLYVNQIAKIPCIDIIDQRNGVKFFDGWHTHQDDIAQISTETLKAVGQTMLDLIYKE